MMQYQYIVPERSEGPSSAGTPGRGDIINGKIATMKKSAASPSNMAGGKPPMYGSRRSSEADVMSKPPAYSSASRRSSEGQLASAGNNNKDERDECVMLDRRALLERSWSSTGNVWQDDDNVDTTHGKRSPFVVAAEETPFGQSWSGGFGGFEDSFGPASRAFSWREDSTLNLNASISHFDFSAGEMYDDSSSANARIHDAARITDWPRVLRLCESHPEAARYKGRDGWTALHHACNRRCPDPEVAEGLIRAYPDALLDEEEKGWTPLHYACRFKAPKDVVRLLLHLFPEKGFAAVSKRDRLGRTPLYYAVRYDAPAGVVGMLLEVDPSAVFEEDKNADSPLALVWDSWADKLEGKRTLHPFLQTASTRALEEASPRNLVEIKNKSMKVLQGSKKFKKRWETANMFLKAAFGFSVDESDRNSKEENFDDEKKDSSQERKWRVLHATVAAKCHMSLFLVARALYPEQAEELDENDLNSAMKGSGAGTSHQTALHLAASSNAVGEAGRNVITSLLRMYQDAAKIADGVDGSLPLHRIVENPHKGNWTLDGANDIYMAYPNAVQMPDRKGRLPLHRAAAIISHQNMDTSTQSIICNILKAYPKAAAYSDMEGCLPLHMVAANAQIWDDEVEALFNANAAAVRIRCGKELDNRLPIHLAAANGGATISLIKGLLELHPQGLAQADRCGKLPLHLACESGKAWEDGGVRAMYEAYPEAVSIPEGNGRRWTALHMAAASDTNGVDLLEKLLHIYPEASRMADAQGRYAFHWACASCKPWRGGLEKLFEANPDALSAVDNKGLLPLHIAAFQFAKNVQEKCEDEGDSSSSVDGGFSLDKEIAAHADEMASAVHVDILYNILRSDPTAVPVKLF